MRILPSMARKAYAAIGMDPTAGIYLDLPNNSCCPLTAVAMHKHGKDKFIALSQRGCTNGAIHQALPDLSVEYQISFTAGFDGADQGKLVNYLTSDEHKQGFRDGQLCRKHLLQEAV